MVDDIEQCFQEKKKAGAVFVDLTAAYDMVWHKGLILKLLRIIPNKKLVLFIQELISNRSFTLTLGNDTSRKFYLKNGVPQGSLLAPMLFNIYTADLPCTTAKKYIYAEDIAIMHCSTDIKAIETTLSIDLNKLNCYFKDWRLKLSFAKTVSSIFHLANRLANITINVKCEDKTIPFEKSPKYLGVVLDRSLTSKQHLEQTAAKIQARNNLLRRLAGISWGANFTLLRTSVLSLAFSVAEYCSPAWHNSSHTKKVDTALNNSMRIITGCIRSMPTELLPILSGISPPNLRREASCINLALKALDDPNHLLHDAICNRNTTILRLENRHPPSNRMRRLMKEANNDNGTNWANKKWQDAWNNNNHRLKQFIDKVSNKPAGNDLPRQAWVKLNRLRTGHGHFRATLHKRGLTDDPICECGDGKVQTADHILYSCPRFRCPDNFTDLDDASRDWLRHLTVTI